MQNCHSHLEVSYVYWTCSHGHIGDMRDIPVYSHALTRRDEGVLDSLVLDEFDPYVVHTLNVSIESSHTAYSTDCHSVLVLLWTVYTAPGKAVSKS